jgi:hypothetical protein
MPLKRIYIQKIIIMKRCMEFHIFTPDISPIEFEYLIFHGIVIPICTLFGRITAKEELQISETYCCYMKFKMSKSSEKYLVLEALQRETYLDYFRC